MKRSAAANHHDGDDHNGSFSSSSSSSFSKSTKTPLFGNRTYKRQKTSDSEPTFDKLNPNDSVHAKRIESRQKMIQKGKNTAGYDCYLQKVPKHQRRARSMDTPSTPDPTLDIPAKRWQGMVKAWRVALHKYDPVDLLVNTTTSTTNTSTTNQQTSSTPVATKTAKQCISTMQVDLMSSPDNQQSNVALEDTTPVSLTSPAGLEEEPSLLFGNQSVGAAAAKRAGTALDFDEEEDSDDDLL